MDTKELENTIASKLRHGETHMSVPVKTLDRIIKKEQALHLALLGLMGDMNVRARMRGDVDSDGTVVLDCSNGVLNAAHAALGMK